MLITATPYSLENKNVGKAYNEFMARLNLGDWGCLCDHDAMFTTKKWYVQIDALTKLYPQAGIFVPYTSNIGCGWMKYPGVSKHNHDVGYHRELGQKIEEENWCRVRDVTEWEKQPSGKPLSGVMMVISKEVWMQVGGFKHGFLTVDNDMHHRIRKAGYKAYLMEGVYVYHWYRYKGRDS